MRLIDADKLIEDYKKELEKVDFEKLSDNDKLIIATSAKALVDFTKRQPIAYNINEIVEELEKLRDKAYKCFCIGHDTEDKAEYNAFDTAVEIVKAGGAE